MLFKKTDIISKNGASQTDFRQNRYMALMAWTKPNDIKAI
jgi:hypothetical protein